MVLPLFFPQKLALIEEQLGKLDTDDPSVIETSLEKYSDLVYLDNISVLHRYVYYTLRCVSIYIADIKC